MKRTPKGHHHALLLLLLPPLPDAYITYPNHNYQNDPSVSSSGWKPHTLRTQQPLCGRQRRRRTKERDRSNGRHDGSARKDASIATFLPGGGESVINAESATRTLRREGVVPANRLTREQSSRYGRRSPGRAMAIGWCQEEKAGARSPLPPPSGRVT